MKTNPNQPTTADKPLIGYKLFKLRKNGTLGPLFINAKQVIPHGTWLEAGDHPTKGFAHRPGWHLCKHPVAPHLKSSTTSQQRVWVKVLYYGHIDIPRPASQGGNWILAKHIKVLGTLEPVQVEMDAVDFTHRDQPISVRNRIRDNIFLAHIMGDHR
jgi:hypothetical protein